MTEELERCPCGRPLHYLSSDTERIVRMLIEDLGPTQRVQVLGAGAWRVPRHYIALHGLVAADLPELAAHYGWEEA